MLAQANQQVFIDVLMSKLTVKTHAVKTHVILSTTVFDKFLSKFVFLGLSFED